MLGLRSFTANALAYMVNPAAAVISSLILLTAPFALSAEAQPTQNLEPTGSPRNVAQATAPASTTPAASDDEMVPVSLQALVEFAKLEAELIKRQKQIDTLEEELRKPRPSASPPGTVNLPALRRFFEGIAQQFGSAVHAELFCSAVKGSVDGGLTIRVSGVVRDQADVQAAQGALERNSLFPLLKSAGLVDIALQADGGIAGGCMIALDPKFFVSKQKVTNENKEAFRRMSLGVLTREQSILPRIPEKSDCAEIGQLLSSFRENGSQVPANQKVLFGSFWVRDGDKLTLCREDGDEWVPAPVRRAVPSWTGLVILSGKI